MNTGDTPLLPTPPGPKDSDLRTAITPERFEKFQRIIGALARDMGLDGAEADDVIQDTMLRAIEHYDPDGMPLTRYVHMVAHGKVIAVLRRFAKSPPPDVMDLKDNLMEEVSDPVGGPRTHVLSMEEGRAIQQAILSLDEDLQRFFRLRYERGMSFEQIGAWSGLSPEQVDTLAKRARREFKRAMALYFKTALGDPTKFRVLDDALEQMTDFYKDPFMWRHANKMTIQQIVERTRKTEPDVKERHIQQRLRYAYKVIPTLKGVGTEGWNKIKSLLRIDPKTGWKDEPAPGAKEKKR